jgi:hypothetical protein
MKTLAVLLMMPENRRFLSDPDFGEVDIPSPSFSPPVAPPPLIPYKRTRLMIDDFDALMDGNCEVPVGSTLGCLGITVQTISNGPLRFASSCDISSGSLKI